MKKIIIPIAFVLLALPSASFAVTLSSAQVDSILAVLTAFGADQATINTVDAILSPPAAASPSPVAVAASSPAVLLTLDPATPTSTNGAYTNIEMARYDASGAGTEITGLYLCAFTTNKTGLANVRVRVGGVQVGSTENIAECTVGTTDFVFSSPIVLASVPSIISVYADNVSFAASGYTPQATNKQVQIVVRQVVSASVATAGQTAYQIPNLYGKVVSAN